jgi:hypothetical protein
MTKFPLAGRREYRSLRPNGRLAREPFWTRRILPMVLAMGVLAPAGAKAWGPGAHRLAEEWAINTLPPQMRAYIQSHRNFILQHANDPREWAKKDRYEKMRQYIFLDKYGNFPYVGLPHNYNMAIQKFGAGKIKSNGVLPWQIGEYSLKLTTAMKAGKWDEAREDAAALGFYVADAHDPFHTTQNYDGQLTGQTGLDERFGTELFDRYSHFFIFRPSDATKIQDPTEYAFRMVLEAHTWLDQVILADRLALGELPGYNEDYFDRFYSRVGSTVMREISSAAHDIGSYWYTAWVNAGQPELPSH